MLATLFQFSNKIHERRKYAEIIKSLGSKAVKGSLAQQASDMITNIMHEDNKYDDLPKKDRERNRKLTLKPSDNAIQPFTIGKKNYLFCESVNGAKASAIIYSIIETAKANGLHVHKYLEFLITELSKRKKQKLLIISTICFPGLRFLKRNAKLLSKNLNSFFKVQLYTKSFGVL